MRLTLTLGTGEDIHKFITPTRVVILAAWFRGHCSDLNYENVSATHPMAVKQVEYTPNMRVIFVEKRTHIPYKNIQDFVPKCE